MGFGPGPCSAFWRSIKRSPTPAALNLVRCGRFWFFFFCDEFLVSGVFSSGSLVFSFFLRASVYVFFESGQAIYSGVCMIGSLVCFAVMAVLGSYHDIFLWIRGVALSVLVSVFFCVSWNSDLFVAVILL